MSNPSSGRLYVIISSSLPREIAARVIGDTIFDGESFAEMFGERKLFVWAERNLRTRTRSRYFPENCEVY